MIGVDLMANYVAAELCFGTPPQVIAHKCGAPADDADHLVGFLSRHGFDGVATDLWLAQHKSGVKR